MSGKNLIKVFTAAAVSKISLFFIHGTIFFIYMAQLFIFLNKIK